MAQKVGSFIQKIHQYLNPYTIAVAVFFIWSLGSRLGIVPNSKRSDDTSDADSARGNWNIGQALLVAVIVLVTHFTLKKLHPSSSPLVEASGITLPEGASILMPNEVLKSSGGSANNANSSFLSGPPPF